MKAKELAAILVENPDKNIVVRYSRDVQYTDYTSGTEGVLVEISEAAVFDEGDRVIIAADLCQEV